MIFAFFLGFGCCAIAYILIDMDRRHARRRELDHLNRQIREARVERDWAMTTNVILIEDQRPAPITAPAYAQFAPFVPQQPLNMN